MTYDFLILVFHIIEIGLLAWIAYQFVAIFRE